MCTPAHFETPSWELGSYALHHPRPFERLKAIGPRSNLSTLLVPECNDKMTLAAKMNAKATTNKTDINANTITHCTRRQCLMTTKTKIKPK